MGRIGLDRRQGGRIAREGLAGHLRATGFWLAHVTPGRFGGACRAEAEPEETVVEIVDLQVDRRVIRLNRNRAPRH